MVRFSQRYGYTDVRTAIQVELLDDESRQAIWNVLDEAQDLMHQGWDSNRSAAVGRTIWTGILGQFRDQFRSTQASTWPMMRDRVLAGPWWDTMDIAEAVVEAITNDGRSNLGPKLARALNVVFENNLVGYRFVDGDVAPIDSDVALSAVEGALHSPDEAVRHHLARALELLSDRQSPDYVNSIKESISAVESAVRVVTGAATLGDGLKKLKTAGVVIHPALEKAWSSMYGWTSDASGIRHGGISAPEATQALAKYMLVTCSAFVSYLLEVGRSTDS